MAVFFTTPAGRPAVPSMMGGPVIPLGPSGRPWPTGFAPWCFVGDGKCAGNGGNGATHHIACPLRSEFPQSAMAPYFPVRWVAQLFLMRRQGAPLFPV